MEYEVNQMAGEIQLIEFDVAVANLVKTCLGHDFGWAQVENLEQKKEDSKEEKKTDTVMTPVVTNIQPPSQ